MQSGVAARPEAATEGGPGGEALDSPAGWRVAGGAHGIIAVTFGSAYAFSALFPALAAEFAASRGAVALIFSLAAFGYYSLGAVAGPLADRWPVNRLLIAGVLAMVIGYGGAAGAGSLTLLYLWYGLGVGIGIGLCYVPAIGAVQSWFERRRSQASGMATAGIGLGTLILPFLAGRLLPVIGWRWSMAGLALIVAVIGLPAALVVRRRAVGAPDGAGPLGRPQFRRVWGDPRFRRFYLVLLLSSFCTFIPYVHVVPAARDLGLPLDQGTALIAIIGVGNVFGRFVLAGLGDRFGRCRLLALLTLAVALSFVLWAVAVDFTGLALFAALFGMSYGGCVGLYPAVAADIFGAAGIGAMLGYLYTAVGISALLGPPLAGVIFDQTHSYLGPILASAAAAALAGVMTFGLSRR